MNCHAQTTARETQVHLYKHVKLNSHSKSETAIEGKRTGRQTPTLFGSDHDQSAYKCQNIPRLGWGRYHYVIHSSLKITPKEFPGLQLTK